MAFWGCLEDPRHSCTSHCPVPAGAVGLLCIWPGSQQGNWFVCCLCSRRFVLAADETRDPRGRFHLPALHPLNAPGSIAPAPPAKAVDESKSHLFRTSGILGTHQGAAPGVAEGFNWSPECAIPTAISAQEISDFSL